MSTLILFCLLSVLCSYVAFKMLKHLMMALLTFLVVFALGTTIWTMFNMKEIQQSEIYNKFKNEAKGFVTDIDKSFNKERAL